MTGIRIGAAQRPPLLIGTPLEAFAADVAETQAADPSIDMLVYPELHLFAVPDGEHDGAAQRAASVPIDSRFVDDLAAIAHDRNIWLVPGSVCERGHAGELFNTALVFAPDGSLRASYRKMFPWRPFEPYDPGREFVVFDLDGVGRFGLSICFDAWFPEHSRHLSWRGAQAVLNIAKTTTPDRAQELVLARANAIANQTFVVSVNCAGPIGRGRSIVVGPEGEILAEADGAADSTLVTDIDPAHADAVRRDGTAGVTQVWHQFRQDDHPIELPLYGGRIEPDRWTPPADPASPHPHEQDHR
jgi:predicted amidohydrolase